VSHRNFLTPNTSTPKKAQKAINDEKQTPFENISSQCSLTVSKGTWPGPPACLRFSQELRCKIAALASGNLSVSKYTICGLLAPPQNISAQNPFKTNCLQQQQT